MFYTCKSIHKNVVQSVYFSANTLTLECSDDILLPSIKGEVHDSNCVHIFSNSANFFLQSSSYPFSVCAQNQSNVCTQSWLCKWETSIVAQTTE